LPSTCHTRNISIPGTIGALQIDSGLGHQPIRLLAVILWAARPEFQDFCGENDVGS
jgi:hypothetical protein